MDNLTTISSVATYSGYTWNSFDVTTMTAIIFFLIIIVIFLLSKNSRAIYGGVITGAIFIVYKILNDIAVRTSEGDYGSIETLEYSIAFILISIFLGYLLERLGYIKKIEDYLGNPNQEEIKKE